MKVDTYLTANWHKVPADAARIEADGYDGAVTVEGSHDPFIPLAFAAEHTKRLEIHTGIAVAFARSPMILANLGHDLNAYSGGRFTLGLGSQIRPHITKRFSMPWGAPAAQMRELILAMRAIWASWYDGAPLEFVGKYYQHTLMTPMFTPRDTEHGPPKVALAAVGPKMTEVAAEVADGLMIHPFSSETYIREVTMPAVERGLKKSGRKRADLEISFPPLIASGHDEETYEKGRAAVAERIAFYGSTPAYKPVLAAEGYGDLQIELNKLSKQGKWDEMNDLVPEELLERIGVVGEAHTIVPTILERFGSLVDRTHGGFGFVDDATRLDMVAALRAG